ncbi:MAG: hypothetical protein UW64_C0005G0026 [Microgenomates group bacterium GW2011_GWC1_44_37]|uniref:Uncharacterized protein n=1 Tax=Candidatus Collierbacteria bacterium GW2011_GWB2_44_22 TaxID=1618387 RepID=A0A0G1KUA2_9BACT|nr:MAG: hypothetical protein UW31_C0008G0005 [Candidatus Collierbacteria bacterium GW2011_GWA2_44_13]KKT51026.1 MAG: hypothetical protein UW42_C0009G0014 [Candidatus Collierbacteria bacterium GW2011_GWB1_44_197]KKT51494.1 MAG: hypothetical protein UW44_C0011G0005 [Candidatus Collierbacteria bacterium GW2011_GWB2_44_22]KKT62231.1 MAG: hypothetical protein UW56_C0009G0005 [Candidatus Collierbacteria bacterium GW2011_GWD1_44_27]KKT66772.1 MAG: hypothetical protein UW58_C0003G0005 [Candidatus Colli
MCAGNYFSSNLGIIISQMTPGTEVIILAGEGIPAVEKETVDIILVVTDIYALTAGGIRLSPMANSDIIFTERHFDKFPICDKARQIQAEVQAYEAALLAELELDDPDPTQKFKGLNIPNPTVEPE